MNEPAPIVYVVDDDPSVRRAIKRLIESVGLQVEHFGPAEEFLVPSPTYNLQLPSLAFSSARQYADGFRSD